MLSLKSKAKIFVTTEKKWIENMYKKERKKHTQTIKEKP